MSIANGTDANRNAKVYCILVTGQIIISTTIFCVCVFFMFYKNSLNESLLLKLKLYPSLKFIFLSPKICISRWGCFAQVTFGAVKVPLQYTSKPGNPHDTLWSKWMYCQFYYVPHQKSPRRMSSLHRAIEEPKLLWKTFLG